MKGVDAIDRQKWEKLLDESKYSSPFQSPAFVNVINASSEFSSDVYAVESDGELKALCVIIFKKKKGLELSSLCECPDQAGREGYGRLAC